MEEEEVSHENAAPKWLKRIQQNSWEPEILLSGFVVIGLIQLPKYINDASYFFLSDVLGGNIQGVFSGLNIATYCLVFGLIMHLFLRGVWIGYVGLSYTFPKGIQQDKFNFQPKYKRNIAKIPSLKSQVDRLEKICSSIFSTCFFIIMCIIGVLISVLLFIGFIYVMDLLTMGWFDSFLIGKFGTGVYDSIISFILFFIAIDFIFVGLFRRHAFIGKLFYPLHKFIGWITLAYFYRPIYYTYASNLNRWYLSAFLALFLFSTIILQGSIQKRPDEHILSRITYYANTNGVLFFPGYYNDRNETWESFNASIPSPILKDRFLELTVKHPVYYEESITAQCDSLSNKEALSNEEKLQCIGQFYQVFIDDVQVEDPDWLFYFFNKSKRKGLIAFLDTYHLSPGKHVLEIKLNSKEITPRRSHAQIVFYKE